MKLSLSRYNRKTGRRSRHRRHAARRFAFEPLESRHLLAVVPAGFTETLVAADLTSPTAIVTAPDGHLFVAQQDGVIRIGHENGLHEEPFATLEVDSSGERGLTGITLDPDFANNGYIYVYYTAANPTSHNRLSRITASGHQMLPGSEVVLLDLPALSTVNDPIYHMGGAIHFGPNDGKLYVSVGDHLDPPKSQSLSSPFGKILRVNPDGTIPIDNPFYATTTGVNRAIWAYGLRNPFTSAFQPETGLFYINDVGQATWEEINEGIAGANYGWPSTEGDFDPQQYPDFVPPVHTYSHAEGCSIVGGEFYPQESTQFPDEYEGMYFFQDFCGGWIRYIDPANPANVSTFATGLDFPVDLTLDAAGTMYYLSRGDATGGQAPGEGALYKISYATAAPPSVSGHPQDQLVSIGYPATFSVAATGTSPLSFQWQHSDAGSGTWNDIPGATSSVLQLPSTSLADNGDQFRAIVTNGFGTATSTAATLNVTANLPPVATISLPVENTTYDSGQTLNFSGSAVDHEDGVLPASAYTWQIDFHHGDHVHPFYPPTSDTTGDTIVLPALGHTEHNVWYRVHLTVRDSIGLTTTTFRDVLPNTVDLTLAANIPGAQLLLDGQPHAAPYSLTGVTGVQRSISAPSIVTVDGQTYQFAGWSDGGAQTHTISTPSTDTTYTANYVPVDVTWLSDLPFAETPENGYGPVERDLSNGEDLAGDGQTLSIRGITYAKGFGVHADSEMTFDLAGLYSTFLADVGVDDETLDAGSVTFQVFADGTLVYDSGVLFGTSPVQLVNIDVTGVNQLRLVVTNGGDSFDSDHANWANARLLVTPLPGDHNFDGSVDAADYVRFRKSAASFPPDAYADWRTHFGEDGSVVPQPPSAPTDLEAAAISGTDIELSWTDTANNESGFEIDRSPDGITGWTQIGSVDSNVTTYLDTGLSTSTTYYYRVRAVNAAGVSGYSNVDSATTPALSVTYLSDLPFVGTTENGYGPVERDLSNGEELAGDGTTLTIRGTTYAKGLGAHAASEVSFALDDAYTTFLAHVGVDDEAAGLGSVSFQVLVDGAIAYDSGVLLGTSPAQPVDVDVTGANLLTLIVTDGGDGIDSDHADWADARLLPAPVQQTVTYLSDLPFSGTPENGYGPVERDLSNGEDLAGDGTTLSIRGTTYAKGLGVHADSEVIFDLNGAYTSFLADVGIDDESLGFGSVVFQVLLDGVLAYDSGVVLGTDQVKFVNVDVTGANQLTLIVTDGGDGTDSDHADWANARLLSTPPQPVAVAIAALAPVYTSHGTPSSEGPTGQSAAVATPVSKLRHDLFGCKLKRHDDESHAASGLRKLERTEDARHPLVEDDLLTLLAVEMLSARNESVGKWA